MSTAPSATQSHGHSTAQAAAHTRPARGPGTAIGAGDATPASDLFASLLSLASAATADAGGSAETGDALTADPNDHSALTTTTDTPLATWLPWAGQAPHTGPAGSPNGAAAPNGPLAARGEAWAAAQRPGRAADTADARSDGAVAIDGMTRVDGDTPLDPTSAAALTSARNRSPEAPAQASGWRPTVASTTALQRQAANLGLNPGTTVSTSGPNNGSATATSSALASRAAEPLRSTVALNERFGGQGDAIGTGPSGTSALPGLGGTGSGNGTGPGTGGQGGHGAPADGRGFTDTLAGAAASGVGDHPADAAASGDGGTPADALAGDGTGADAAGSTAHWSSGQLRHASLRVGEHPDQAIDIQLSLNGQEARVDFRTDNAEARASLAQNAGESLGELLQRSGIQLADVSVRGQSAHAQHQGGAQGQAGQHPQAGSTLPGARRAGTDTGADSAGPAAPVRLRADGSRPLDLFV